MTGLGSEEMVFDYGTEHCPLDQWDIPDQPARAFRDAQNRVHLHFAHHEPRRNIGTSLNDASNLGSHDCAERPGSPDGVTSWSNRNPDPAAFDDYTWLSAPYTLDGITVYSLTHQEYRGWHHTCPLPPNQDTTKCWYNSVNLSTSTTYGDLFTHTAAPTHVAITMPDVWVDGTGPYGVFSPSNIIKKNPDDGYLYSVCEGEGAGRAGHQLPDPHQQHRRPDLVARLGRLVVQRALHQPLPRDARQSGGPRLQGRRSAASSRDCRRASATTPTSASTCWWAPTATRSQASTTRSRTT